MYTIKDTSYGVINNNLMINSLEKLIASLEVQIKTITFFCEKGFPIKLTLLFSQLEIAKSKLTSLKLK